MTWSRPVQQASPEAPSWVTAVLQISSHLHPRLPWDPHNKGQGKHPDYASTVDAPSPRALCARDTPHRTQPGSFYTPQPRPDIPLTPPQMVSSLLPSLLDFLWQKLAYLIFKHIFMLRSPETITEKTTRFPKNHPAPSRCQFREAAHSALQSLPALGLLKNLTLSQTSRFWGSVYGSREFFTKTPKENRDNKQPRDPKSNLLSSAKNTLCTQSLVLVKSSY